MHAGTLIRCMRERSSDVSRRRSSDVSRRRSSDVTGTLIRCNGNAHPMCLRTLIRCVSGRSSDAQGTLIRCPGNAHPMPRDTFSAVCPGTSSPLYAQGILPAVCQGTLLLYAQGHLLPAVCPGTLPPCCIPPPCTTLGIPSLPLYCRYQHLHRSTATGHRSGLKTGE